jgi:hypothetical protein
MEIPSRLAGNFLVRMKARSPWGGAAVMSQLTVKRGVSYEADAATICRELADSVADPDAVVVLVFAAPTLDTDAIARELAEVMAPAPVVGCTTAGEIGPDGFHDGSVVAMSLSSPGLRVAFGLVPNISQSPLSAGRSAMQTASKSLGFELGQLDPRSHVGVSLIDGWSGGEEMFIAGASGSAPTIPLVGGSASDSLEDTPHSRIFHNGVAHPDSGLIILFESEIPFATVISEHMIPTDRRVVVTASDPGTRLVQELNGRPAREVYEEIVGAAHIDTPLASQNPFGYYVGGQAFVRSVMAVEGDALRFACAVDHGAVLRPMRPGDMVGTTRDALAAAAASVGGELCAVVAFNCLGRFLEARDTGKQEQLEATLADYPVVGFNTFGEQYNALHVNHTLTALAFGCGDNA